MKFEHTILTLFFVLIAVFAVWQSLNDPEKLAGRVYVKQVEGQWVPADEIDRKAGIAEVGLSRSIGLWVGAFFTMFIFSFLYRDNPFYKMAEATVVGVSAGYVMVVGFWTTIIPNLLGKLTPGLIQQWAMPGLSPEQAPGAWVYIFPLILGIMLIMRLIPKVSWISVWPLAFIIGTTAGLRMVAFLEADFLSQIENSIVPFVVLDKTNSVDYWQSFQNIFLVVSILACLVYFFFSIEHKGAVGKVSRFGIWILMITFGAMFGMTVMGRIALLAIRLEFLFRDWLNLHL